MEDLFYCGESSFTESIDRATPKVEPEKIWRIKTEQEFIETLGPNWHREIRHGGGWNPDGDMIWLLGKPVEEVLHSTDTFWPAPHAGRFSVSDRIRTVYYEGTREGYWTIWPYYDIVYDYPV